MSILAGKAMADKAVADKAVAGKAVADKAEALKAVRKDHVNNSQIFGPLEIFGRLYHNFPHSVRN